MGFNKVLVDARAVEFSRVHAKVFNKDVKDFKVAQAVKFSKELHVQVKAVVKECHVFQVKDWKRQGLTGCQGPNVGGVTPRKERMQEILRMTRRFGPYASTEVETGIG